MNKKLVEQYTSKAYELMSEPDNKPPVKTSIKAQISTFGAAVSSGSLLSAIAFFTSEPRENEERIKEEAKKTRQYLINLINDIIRKEKGNLFDYVSKEIKEKRQYEVKEKVISAAIAVKLALNLFK